MGARIFLISVATMEILMKGTFRFSIGDAEMTRILSDNNSQILTAPPSECSTRKPFFGYTSGFCTA